MIGIGIALLLIYSLNGIYKVKWDTVDVNLSRDVNNDIHHSYTKVAGDCASIPTTYWTRTIMDVMVNVDFVVSSLLPFILMIVSNIFIIKTMIKIREKVI